MILPRIKENGIEECELLTNISQKELSHTHYNISIINILNKDQRIPNL